MNKLDKIISQLDFSFFGSGQHKIEADNFLKKDNAVLLDLRAREETETLKLSLRHHLPVLEIPFHELPARLNELPRDKFIGLFGSSGVRSSMAFIYLKAQGFENIRLVDGGYEQLVEALKPGKIFKRINNQINSKDT
ncbi:MAG: rhodanese-like domain-containing protein [Candidatus Saccharicenans sp.]|nr:rhodanese-like domain-containing protein [Candidatus Saccharicenans sp.]MDH7493975.1 rhodanese-like domain-containing protein [Candidatus Saccharicenans sp.]